MSQQAPPAPSVPRWVKIFGIVAAVVAIVVVVILIAGGGEHGPRRHLPGGVEPSDHTPPIHQSS